MLAGLTLVFLVLLRMIWGMVGTTHAKFSGFALNPTDLLGYFKGILSGSKRRWAGHNPASSWAALIMMGLALGLGITGYLMTSGPDKETWEEIHELLGNGFMVVVLGHVAGIVLHTIRHKEMIGLSMLDGKKADISLDRSIPSAKLPYGLLLLGLVSTFAIYLFNNFDSQARTLQLFGTQLQLGENEQGEEGQEGEKGSEEAGEEGEHDD
jgi:cytochrome b